MRKTPGSPGVFSLNRPRNVVSGRAPARWRRARASDWDFRGRGRSAAPAAWRRARCRRCRACRAQPAPRGRPAPRAPAVPRPATRVPARALPASPATVRRANAARRPAGRCAGPPPEAVGAAAAVARRGGSPGPKKTVSAARYRIAAAARLQSRQTMAGPKSGAPSRLRRARRTTAAPTWVATRCREPSSRAPAGPPRAGPRSAAGPQPGRPIPPVPAGFRRAHGRRRDGAPDRPGATGATEVTGGSTGCRGRALG